jgi:hypothetical protein
VRAWEVLAAVTTTTTTTTTSTTTSTTTTLVQSVGSQGGGGSSDVWVPLLAALVGAIVGGLLALAGSVLVNRWELRRTARFRVYQELLPRVMNETWPRFRWHGEQAELFEQSMDALQRASTVPGPREWLAAFYAQLNAGIYLNQVMSELDPDEEQSPSGNDAERQEGTQALEDIAKQIDDDLERLDGILEMQIKRMWGPWWWRRWLMRRRKKAVAKGEGRGSGAPRG